MRNLAGHPDADKHCEAELIEAGIRVDRLAAPQNDEVSTSITGRLGDIVLTRAWYYWRAHGKVPLDLAKRLYADPIGKRDVRVAGHCGCPPPEEWCRWFDGDEEVEIDPDGTDEAEFDSYIARGKLPADLKPRYAKSTDGLQAYVLSYHIDSAEGLRLFVDVMKGDRS